MERQRRVLLREQVPPLAFLLVEKFALCREVRSAGKCEAPELTRRAL